MYNHRLKLALSFVVHVSLMAAAVSCGDDDDATGTDGETTGAGDSQGADCDNVAGTQPCNCLTTVVAVGKQTCTDEGWSACECPGACDELRAVNDWCPNVEYAQSSPVTQTDNSKCGGRFDFWICMCGKSDASFETQRSCLPASDTGSTDETTGDGDE